VDNEVNHSIGCEVRLRMTDRQNKEISDHLYPGDGREAVALALCGRVEVTTKQRRAVVFSIHTIVIVPYEDCFVRTCDQVQWKTDLLPALLENAVRRNLYLLKIHSHPGGYRKFSKWDDRADKELFTGVAGWLDTDMPGVSAVMLPSGELFGRGVDYLGNFISLASTLVTGDNICLWRDKADTPGLPEYTRRTAQTFGQSTTESLSHLSIGVVGCSGTGSPLVEMLTRLGVGELVLVDPDRVEEKNLNRIYNATIDDARAGRYKVDVLADAIKRMGLGTKVTPIARFISDADVVRQVAFCDVVFGCMDSIEGRNILNRICVFYSIPYFDLGVRLIADGSGGVNQVCGTVNYLRPDGSSLLERGLYTPEQLRAEALYNNDPQQYAELRKDGYILGVPEDRPAVIHVNTHIASLAVNEFLARIHPFRDDENSAYAMVTASLSQMRLICDEDNLVQTELSRYVGRGDMRPLLNMPQLTL
jgi:hypothetical protein